MRALKAVRQQLRSYNLKSGVFHFYRGEHGPAAEYLTRALTEEDDRLSSADRRSALYYLVQTRIGAATRFEQGGEIERAIAEYQVALEVMPGYPDVHMRLGNTLVNARRCEEAVEQYRRAVEINPNYVAAHVQLGFTLLELERANEASESFRAARAAQEAICAKKVAEAEAAIASGATETARDIYQDAFYEDRTRFQGLLRDGLAQLKAEKWEDAAEVLHEATLLCPRYADVRNYLGVALAEQGETADAIDAFERSVEINGSYLVGWLNLAYVSHEHGDLKRARHALDQVLAREPDNAPALHLAEVLEGEAAGSGQKRGGGSSPPSAQGK